MKLLIINQFRTRLKMAETATGCRIVPLPVILSSYRHPRLVSSSLACPGISSRWAVSPNSCTATGPTRLSKAGQRAPRLLIGVWRTTNCLLRSSRWARCAAVWHNPTSNIMLAVRKSFQMEGSDLGSDPAAGGGDEVRAEGAWIDSSRCSSSRIE